MHDTDGHCKADGTRIFNISSRSRRPLRPPPRPSPGGAADPTGPSLPALLAALYHLVTGLRPAIPCSSWRQSAGLLSTCRRLRWRMGPPGKRERSFHAECIVPIVPRRRGIGRRGCSHTLGFRFVGAGPGRERPLRRLQRQLFRLRDDTEVTARPSGFAAPPVTGRSVVRGTKSIFSFAATATAITSDLGGAFRADAGDHISGNWTETTRGVGGSAVGVARGGRLQLHVESSAFSATMYITSRGSRQSVSIDGQGGGQNVKASLTLRKR